jgi:hypothetical protein
MAAAWKLLRTFGLAVLWLGTVGLMASSAASDPFDPALTGTAAYGHNGEGALLQGAVITTIEAIGLHLLLKPWRAGRSWAWPLVTLLWLGPWTLISAVLTMHQGGVITIHLLWLLVASVVVFASLVVTVLGAFAKRAPVTSGPT